MSNGCSNLCNYRSFSLCTPFLTPLKPYTTTRRPFFQFQHNIISIGRRERRRSSSFLLKVACQSSSDIVLIETKEHHDGSLVFRFGDASEVVENDDVVEEIESQTEQESSVVKVLDGDQDRQVIIETRDSKYDSVDGRLVEVSDGIRTADIGSDIAESETNGIRDLSDYHAEASDKLSDKSEKEVFVSQSDDNLNDNIRVVAGTLDEAKFNVELDEEESSDPTISLLDDTPYIEKSAYSEGTLLKASDDNPVDPSVSVELESTQVSQTEVKADLDKVEPEDTMKSDTEDVSGELESTKALQIEVMDDLDKVETDGARKTDTEEITPSAFPATMHISENKLTDAANEDLEEELKDIDELPPSKSLDVQLTGAVNEDSEEDLQDMNINETTIIDDVDKLQDMNVNEASVIDEMPSSDQTMEDELQEVSAKNEEDDIADMMPVSCIEEAEINVQEEVSQPQSTPLELKPTIQVLDIDLQDTMGQDQDNGILQDDNEITDLSVSSKLEAIQVSDKEVMDTSEGETEELLFPATMHVSDVDTNICEGTFTDEIPTSDQLGSEPTFEVSNDVDMAERLNDTKLSEGNFIDKISASDPTFEVPYAEGMDVKNLAVEDGLQLVSNDVDMDERLQDMNISDGTFIGAIQASDPIGAEPTLGVSSTEGANVKDLVVEDELQLVSNDKMDENEIADVMSAEPILEEQVSQAHLTPVELKATMQVSDIKVQDSIGQNLGNEILQVIHEDADDSYIEDTEQSSHQLESHLVQEEGVKDNTLEQCEELEAVESSILSKVGAIDPLLEVERTEGMVGSSELAEASEVTASLLAAGAEVEREELYLTDVFLLSGAASLEHPFKALTGGDDAYFVAGSKWLGVANGVSQWSFEGTCPGVFSQNLMRTCEKFVLDTSSNPMTSPVELLCRGLKETNMSGSSSVLIANFNSQALHVANIGDTGFLIIRHGAVYKKSSPLLHEFHFAVHVDASDDPLQLVEEYLVELEVGDIVVFATDGLFDNLYEREITMIVTKSLQAGMKPQEIANILATRAQEVGKSSFVRSPFSDAAQAAGYTGYAGGKPDDVAVIVSLVEKSSNPLAV